MVAGAHADINTTGGTCRPGWRVGGPVATEAKHTPRQDHSFLLALSLRQHTWQDRSVLPLSPADPSPPRNPSRCSPRSRPTCNVAMPKLSGGGGGAAARARAAAAGCGDCAAASSHTSATAAAAAFVGSDGGGGGDRSGLRREGSAQAPVRIASIRNSGSSSGSSSDSSREARDCSSCRAAAAAVCIATRRRGAGARCRLRGGDCNRWVVGGGGAGPPATGSTAVCPLRRVALQATASPLPLWQSGVWVPARALLQPVPPPVPTRALLLLLLAPAPACSRSIGGCRLRPMVTCLSSPQPKSETRPELHTMCFAPRPDAALVRSARGESDSASQTVHRSDEIVHGA